MAHDAHDDAYFSIPRREGRNPMAPPLPEAVIRLPIQPEQVDRFYDYWMACRSARDSQIVTYLEERDAAYAAIGIIAMHSASRCLPPLLESLADAGMIHKVAERQAGTIAEAVEPGRLQSLQQIKAIVQELEATRPFDHDLQLLTKQVRYVHSLAARTFNLSAHDGTGFPYEVVPFPDGTDPTVQRGLPRLSSSSVIRNLNEQQVDAYFEGYFPDSAQDLGQAEKRQRIAMAIGCGRL